MKANEYALLVRCIEEGTRYGLFRAHKHTAIPADEELQAAIEDAVLNEICAWFEFSDGCSCKEG